MVSWFWRQEVQNKGVSRVVLPPRASGEESSLPRPASLATSTFTGHSPCISVSKFPSPYKDTSPIGWDPPWWPHVNLITSAKTLFSNKSHSSVLGLGLHCLCEGHKPVTSLNWVFEIIKEWMWRASCSRGPLIRWRTWTDYCSGVPARLVTLCPLISWFLQPPEKGALVTQKHEHHGWGDAMNGLCLLILLLSYLLKVPSLTTQSLSWNIPELEPTSFPVMRLSPHCNLFSLCPSRHIQEKRSAQVVCQRKRDALLKWRLRSHSLGLSFWCGCSWGNLNCGHSMVSSPSMWLCMAWPVAWCWLIDLRNALNSLRNIKSSQPMRWRL